MSATFKEIGRVKASPSTELVLSQVWDGKEMKGLNFNTFITSEKYTGYTKGTLIPAGSMEQFGELVKKALAS